MSVYWSEKVGKKTLYIFVVQWVLENGVEGIGNLFFNVAYILIT